jgi:hypothetical protein
MFNPPVSADVQFVPGAGKLYIDNLVDPSGKPLTVLDIDDGFTVEGRIELPGWLSGRGIVRLCADEIGGPFDDTIGTAHVAVTGSSSPHDPPSKQYAWSITVKSPTLPDVSKMYQFGLVFVLETLGGGHTDIGGFYDLGAFLVV